MEYIKLSYHHLNFEDRTALMLESRKEGFSARKFAMCLVHLTLELSRAAKRRRLERIVYAQHGHELMR